jgi:hypothetical protein
MRNLIIVAFFVLYIFNGIATARANDIFEVETEGDYQMGLGTSVELAKKMALFNGQRKAVEVAGRYLSRKSLIEQYESNRDEIYSLTAREIHANIIEEKIETVGKTSTYRLRIRSTVQATDFIKAEIEAAKIEKKEAQESYRDEMGQHISAEIDPGIDIAKAYRLLRERKWRIAIIYLDHLEGKYPTWGRIYMAKAMTYYLYHETEFMIKALNKACRLGNYTACDDLKNIKKLNTHDFGLSVID